MPARAWGVEHLSPLDRVEKVLHAGCDQFGGEACPELVIELVKKGRVSEERLDTSVRRLLREKFRLGLFEQRHVDIDMAGSVVGQADFAAAGLDAQRASYTLLTNHDDILPAHHGSRRLHRRDRPGRAAAVCARRVRPLINYGRSTRALTDVAFGLASPQGRLPFDLPSSTSAVEHSRTDVPFDTTNPLFRYGDGASYLATAT